MKDVAYRFYVQGLYFLHKICRSISVEFHPHGANVLNLNNNPCAAVGKNGIKGLVK
jgi:hypothetical protein